MKYSIALVVCLAWLYPSLAYSDMYVIAAAPSTQVKVGHTGDTSQSGANLLQAVAKIEDASKEKRYQVILSAGTYDLDGESLKMKPYVDIIGAGKAETMIRGAYCTEYLSEALVKGAEGTKISNLSVRNLGCAEGTHTNALAIHGDAMVVEDVRLESWGYTGVISGAVSSYSNATYSDVEFQAFGSGGSRSYALFDFFSNTYLLNATIEATSADINKCVYSYSSRLVAKNMNCKAMNGKENYGVDNLYDAYAYIENSYIECEPDIDMDDNANDVIGIHGSTSSRFNVVNSTIVSPVVGSSSGPINFVAESVLDGELASYSTLQFRCDDVVDGNGVALNEMCQ